MTELVLFIVVGALAVAAAVMMLLSNNAVHSALFLIVTMGCLAFLFLLLNAPFLAMIQITVYAGAIMVLFLFVIMLLGAERLQPDDPGPEQRRYRWYTPMALFLALSLLIAGGLTIIQSRIDLVRAPTEDPQVRVVNVAGGVPDLTLYANGQPIASDLRFSQWSDFVSLPTGETALSLTPDGDAVVTLTLEPNTVQTLIAYGADAVPLIGVVPTDLTQLASDRTTRITMFNGYQGAPTVSLWDLGSEFAEDDNYVIIPPVVTGERSSTFVERERTVTWTVVPEERIDQRLYTMLNVELPRGTDSLYVIAEEPLGMGQSRVVNVEVVTPVAASFGGPRAIGETLFIDYLLPFQLLAVLLLASMVGAIVLTHRHVEKNERKQGRRKVSRPLTNVLAAQVGHEVVDEPDSLKGAPASPAAPDTAGD